MNLSDLENIVAAYHQKVIADFTINGVDMFLSTINEIRRDAELLHDFEFSRCRATLAIDGVTGGSLDDAIIYDPASTVVVTGTDDPTVNGTYTQLPMFNLAWAYTNGTFFIFFNTFYNSYIISDGLVDGQRTYFWLPAVPRIVPQGDYSRASGSENVDEAVLTVTPNFVDVTGTTDPHVNGHYVQEAPFNGLASYQCTNLLGTFYMYYNTFYSSYVISDGLVDGMRTYVWVPSVPRNIPGGTYVHGFAIDTAVTTDPPDFVTVTSEGDPTVNGVYKESITFNGYISYTTGLYYMYYNTFYSSFVISDGLMDGERNYVWVPAIPRTVPNGDYELATIVTDQAVLVNTFASIKQVIAAQRVRSDGRIVPLDFTRSDIPIERDRYIMELRDDWWPVERYPSDAQILSQVSRATLIQRRRQLFIYPADVPQDTIICPPLQIQIEALGFLPDWTTADLEGDSTNLNWFVIQGFNWMKWKTIYELNPLFSTFVPRQEGNVSNDPKVLLQYIAEAWEKFVLWDNYQIDANSTRSR